MFPCPLCVQTFASVPAVHVHCMVAVDHHYCIKCRLLFRSFGELIQHQPSICRGPLQDPTANPHSTATPVDVDSLTDQLSSTHIQPAPPVRYQCPVPVCGRYFASYLALTAHCMDKRDHYYCPNCCTLFRTKGELQNHQPSTCIGDATCDSTVAAHPSATSQPIQPAQPVRPIQPNTPVQAVPALSYRCSLTACKRSFISESALKEHCMAEIDHHYCENCCLFLTSKVKLRKHLSSCRRRVPTPASSPDLEEDVSPGPTPVDAFFAEYPSFAYNRSRPFTPQFLQLLDQLYPSNQPRVDARDLGGPEHQLYKRFKRALVLLFNEMYGTDLHSMDSWRKLCTALWIHPIPSTLKGCRLAVVAKRVNIVDLLEVNEPRPVREFSTIEGLAVYTFASFKVIPTNDAYAGGLLRFLLHHLTAPGRG